MLDYYSRIIVSLQIAFEQLRLEQQLFETQQLHSNSSCFRTEPQFIPQKSKPARVLTAAVFERSHNLYYKKENKRGAADAHYEQLIRDYSALDSELGTRNTKTSCFVYIDTNTRTPSRNTKQTRKIGKFTYNPRSFKSYHSPLRSRLSLFHPFVLKH